MSIQEQDYTLGGLDWVSLDCAPVKQRIYIDTRFLATLIAYIRS